MKIIYVTTYICISLNYIVLSLYNVNCTIYFIHEHMVKTSKSNQFNIHLLYILQKKGSIAKSLYLFGVKIYTKIPIPREYFDTKLAHIHYIGEKPRALIR